MYLKLSNISEQ